MGLIAKVWHAVRHRLLRRKHAKRFDRDPVAVAQILLLFRMILADGVIRDPELAVFAEICRERFDIEPHEMAALHSYLERRDALADRPQREALLQSMGVQARLELIGMMGRIASACVARTPAEARRNGGEVKNDLLAEADARFIRETAIALGVPQAGK